MSEAEEVKTGNGVCLDFSGEKFDLDGLRFTNVTLKIGGNTVLNIVFMSF